MAEDQNISELSKATPKELQGLLRAYAESDGSIAPRLLRKGAGRPELVQALISQIGARREAGFTRQELVRS